MIEYRLKNLTTDLADILTELGAFIAEEEFKGEVTYVIYSADEIGDILTELNIEFESKDVEETGWQERWKEFIKEDWLNDSIYFIFEPKTFPDNRKTLIINPSLAFGTGTHATTRVAAKLLEPVANGASMLDIGTGSGILAIAASLLGAVDVSAFDIDPVALPNCLENINANNRTNIKAWSGGIESVPKGEKYDIVCANIISSVLLELSPDINKLAEKCIIYSGILSAEFDNVIDKLTPSGWRVDGKIVIDEWCGVRLINERFIK